MHREVEVEVEWQRGRCCGGWRDEVAWDWYYLELSC